MKAAQNIQAMPASEVSNRGSFMESFLLVLNKAAKMIAPFKATESKVVVLAALTDVFIEHGFSLEQALILSVKAYEIA